MPPSSHKDYFKCMEVQPTSSWPQTDMSERSFDMFLAPPAPLNSTEFIMDNYYEAERTNDEVVSTPDRLFEDTRPFNLNGSMLIVRHQVASRCT